MKGRERFWGETSGASRAVPRRERRRPVPKRDKEGSWVGQRRGGKGISGLLLQGSHLKVEEGAERSHREGRLEGGQDGVNGGLVHVGEDGGELEQVRGLAQLALVVELDPTEGRGGGEEDSLEIECGGRVIAMGRTAAWMRRGARMAMRLSSGSLKGERTEEGAVENLAARAGLCGLKAGLRA